MEGFRFVAFIVELIATLNLLGFDSIRCLEIADDVCQPDAIQRFSNNVDSTGMELCGTFPRPIETFAETQHHGACLEICAEHPGCYSYNYHHDTTTCEIFCVPTEYAIIKNCYNYLVSKVTTCDYVFLWFLRNPRLADNLILNNIIQTT